MNSSITDDDRRKARLARFEGLGLDRVKADLHSGGMRDVGGSLEVRELAWEWVKIKEAEVNAAATANAQAATAKLSLISEVRIDEVRALGCHAFDLKKLIRLCEEINITYAAECYFATGILTRALLDHVPPIFKKTTFAEVANNYAGSGKSFKELMQNLDAAARKVADRHLHGPIRKSETLPTAQQVHCGQQLDVLLAEIVSALTSTDSDSH